MSDTTSNSGGVWKFTRLLGEISGFKKMMLSVAVLIAGAGGVGALAGKVKERPAEVQQAHSMIEELSAVARTTQLTDDQQQKLESAEQTRDAHATFLTDKLSPHAWRAAISFLVAFAVGYAFRAFIKTAAVVSGAIIAVVAALSYFEIIDLTNVRAGVEKSASLVTKFATHAKDVVLAWLPSSVTSTLGVFAGFTRKK